MKKREFPCFDELVKLAKTDPEKLNEIRRQATSELIDNAPVQYQRRLRGLQFQIDMELRRAKSAMDGCVRVSNMMHDSLWKLRDQLNLITGKYGEPTHIRTQPVREQAVPLRLGPAKIIPFRG